MSHGGPAPKWERGRRAGPIQPAARFVVYLGPGWAVADQCSGGNREPKDTGA